MKSCVRCKGNHRIVINDDIRIIRQNTGVVARVVCDRIIQIIKIRHPHPERPSQEQGGRVFRKDGRIDDPQRRDRPQGIKGQRTAVDVGTHLDSVVTRHIHRASRSLHDTRDLGRSPRCDDPDHTVVFHQGIGTDDPGLVDRSLKNIIGRPGRHGHIMTFHGPGIRHRVLERFTGLQVHHMPGRFLRDLDLDKPAPVQRHCRPVS